MKKILSLFVLLSVMIQANAQDVEMATGLRSSGKIYVVVIVILVIFIGLLGYLFSIDRRLKKLEKED
ncbi:MAG TPA: CcmD family protein [Pedobacter sp.]|jgi:CcmD family protein